jgi:adenylate cyclase
MFTDIERFTETLERIGDDAAHRLLQTHNMIVRSRLAANAGRELKSMGDGFLVVFPSILRAVTCAAAIQSDFAEHNATNWEPLNVRIGIHAGGVIRERQDVHGRNVVLAARIAELANGGQVLVSAPVRAVAERSRRFRFDAGRTAKLAGIEGEHRVHALL